MCWHASPFPFAHLAHGPLVPDSSLGLITPPLPLPPPTLFFPALFCLTSWLNTAC